MRMIRSTLFASSALALLLLNHPVMAQTANPSPQSVDTDNQGLGDIVVTARKREENLQQTPISISAFNTEALESKGVTRIDEITRSAPNLLLRNDPGSSGATSAAAVFIRGVGQKEYLAGLEPGVGIYVDGVYLARNAGSVLDLADIERVEVLRGPQGTLFGKNTIGGAINVTTAQPNSALSGKATLTYGSDNRVNLIGTINVPLSDKVFTRASVGLFKRDGYVARPFDGRDLGNENRLTGRFAIRFEPVNNFDVTVAVDGTRIREHGPPALLRQVDLSSRIFNPNRRPIAPPGTPNPTNQFYVLNPPAGASTGDIPLDNFALYNNYVATFLGGQQCISPFFAPYNPEFSPNNPACFGNRYATERQRVNSGTSAAFSNFDIWGGNLTLNYDFGTVQIKSITAYRETKADYSTDNDGSPLLISTFGGSLTQSQLSQEVQLSGRGFDDRLVWVIGGFYMDERADNPEPVDFAPLSLRASAGPLRTETLAGFGQATFAVTPRFKLTAGIRYTDDKKSYSPDQVITADRTGGALPVGTRLIPLGIDRTSFSQWTPMVNAAYQFTDDFMMYGTYSKGFKGGGYNQRVFPPRPRALSFGPESLQSYEAGFKWTSADRRLRVNGAAYYTEYSDIQVQVVEGIAPVTKNGGDARIQGFELELNAAPWRGGRLEAAVGLVDAKFTRLDPNVSQLTLNSKFDRTPKWTASASLLHEFSVGSVGTITPRVAWNYRSSEFQDAENRLEILQPAVNFVDGSLTWRSQDEKFSLTASVNNIFDEYVITGYYETTSGIFTVYPNRGREWALTLRAGF